jgi:hypothetical protein
MDIAAITELITTVGFPIACVIALGVFVFIIYKRSEEREDKLMEEIAQTRIVNAQAIETISKFANSIDVIKTDITEIKNDITILAGKIE